MEGQGMSRQILELLKLRYPPPEWAAFPELRAGTGYAAGSDTRLDFFALNLYPGMRFTSVAYEVKVSRSDFLRELTDHGKRAFAEKVGNETWFVGPAGVFKEEEIPEGWGLLVMQADGVLKRVRAAPWRKVEPYTMPFIASLARRAAAEGKPVLPPGVWRYCGRDVSEGELLELMKDAYGSLIREEASTRAREDVDAWLRGDGHQADMALLKIVKETCDIWGGSHDGVARFREWAEAQRVGMDLRDKNALAYHAGELVRALKGVGVELPVDPGQTQRRQKRKTQVVPPIVDIFAHDEASR